MKRIQGYSGHGRLVLRTAIRLRANPAGRGAKALRDRPYLLWLLIVPCCNGEKPDAQPFCTWSVDS
jgi:hypothetical protein